MATRHYADGYRLFDTDMDAMLLGLQGIGVLAGLACSATGTSTSVSWTAGVAKTSSGEVSISASSVDLSSLQSASAPKKALIYVDATDGTVKAVGGTAMTAQPTGKVGRETWQPAPPDFSGSFSLDSGDVVLAEIWLPTSGSNILSSYVSDRRVTIRMDTEPADYVVFSSGSNYFAKNCETGEMDSYGSSYDTVYAAALAALPSGTGVIIDKTDGMGPGPTTNRYASGVLYAPEFYIQNSVAEVRQTLSACDEGWGVGWTGANGADDTDNFKAGKKSIALTDTNAAGSAYGDFVFTARNLTRHAFWARLHVDTWTGFNQFAVYFGCGGFTNYYSATVGVATTERYGNWMELSYRLGDFFGAVGSPSWATVDRIRIKYFSAAGYTHTVTIDEWGVVPEQTARGCIMLTFDDGDEAAVQGFRDYAMPAMDKYGFKGTHFWNSAQNTAEDLENVVAKYENGWDIGNHTHDHLALNTGDKNLCATQAIKCLRYQAQQGVLSRTRVVSTPGGSIDWDSEQILKQYFHLCFLTNNSTATTWPHGSKFRIWRGSYDAQTLATLQTLADDVESDGRFMVWLFHNVGPSATYMTEANWTTLMAYLQTKNIDVMTPTQLLATYPPRDVSTRPSTPSFFVYKQSAQYFAADVTTGRLQRNSSLSTLANACVDALPYGGKITLARDRYYLDGTINIDQNGIELCMESMWRGAYQYADTQYAGITLNAAVNLDMFYISGRKCHIHDLYLEGNGGNQTAGNGIYTAADASLDLHLEDCYIFGCKTAGVYLRGGAGTFRGVYCEYSYGDGFYLANDATKNSFFGCGGWWNTGSGWKLVTSTHNSFHGCSANDNSNYGMILQQESNYCVVDGCKILDNGLHGIMLYGSSFNNIGLNDFRDNGKTTNNTYSQIHLSAQSTLYSTHNRIIGNMLSSGETNKPKYGICEVDVNEDYNIIALNTSMDAATAEILKSGANSVADHNIEA